MTAETMTASEAMEVLSEMLGEEEARLLEGVAHLHGTEREAFLEEMNLRLTALAKALDALRSAP